MSDLLKKAYAAFDPEPLKADGVSAQLYVDLDDVRGGTNVAARLAQKIRLSKHPLSQVLAGHRGSGKSTELYRLQHDLERGADRHFIVFCTADDDIDRNDVDFLEVLIAFMRQMAVQLKDRADIELKPGYFADRFERIKQLLGSPVEFQGMSLALGLTEVSGILKASPDARIRLREKIDPDTKNWIYAANQLIGAAKQQLIDRDYRDLVVVVDDLDKMVLRPHAKAACSTAEYLFVHREAQLTAFECHVIYSMPLALAHSLREQTIRQLYGGDVPVLPMIKVRERPPSREASSAGVERCRAMIERRLQVAGLSQREVFADGAVVDGLIRWSGGQPREMMHFVREALITALPITTEALDRAVRDRRRAFARQLREEHRPILERVRDTGTFERNETTDALVRELLDGRALLPYLNDGEWYDLNPVIDDMYPRTSQRAPRSIRAKRTARPRRSKRAR